MQGAPSGKNYTIWGRCGLPLARHTVLEATTPLSPRVSECERERAEALLPLEISPGVLEDWGSCSVHIAVLTTGASLTEDERERTDADGLWPRVGERDRTAAKESRGGEGEREDTDALLTRAGDGERETGGEQPSTHRGLSIGGRLLFCI